MNYEMFKKELMMKLEELDKNKDFTIKSELTLKNNGLKLDSLIMKKDDSEIAPIIYINEWYEEYLKGKSVEEIADEILLLSGKVFEKDNLPIIPEFKWETIKDQLYVSVINADANEELLKETPHRRMDDLAVIAKILIEQPGEEKASIRVTNTVLPMLTKTKDEILNQAIKNTEKLDFRCRTMREVVMEMFTDDLDITSEMFPSENEIPMFVVTRSDSTDGASVLACKNALAKMADMVGEDVYILPSSIYEVLLVPKSSGMKLEELQEMVREVNRNEVAAGDILSDNVYQFDRKTKKLSIAKTYENAEKKTISKKSHMTI